MMKYLINSILILILLNVLTLKVIAKDDIVIQYDLDGNVVNLNCDFSQTEPRFEVKILSVTGGSGNYTVIPLIEGAVSKLQLMEGEGFSYFFSKEDQNNRTIGFTITDEAGNSCEIDLRLISQLEVVNINQACSCNVEMSIAVKPGTLTDTLSCGFNSQGEPALFVEVSDVSGGITNANYEIEPLQVGEISTSYLTDSPFRFYYAITQNDIDSNKPLGFKIFDGNNCFYERRFTVPASIKMACDINCFITGEIPVDENNAIQYGCDVINDELVAHINYNNITGGNGNFIYEAMVGSISNAVTSGLGSLTYSFTPEDFATGQIDFFIKDTAINCVTHIDIAKLVTAFPYKACNLCDYTLNLTKNSSGNIDTACDLQGDDRVVVAAFIETDSELPILLNSFVGELSKNEVMGGDTFEYRFNGYDFVDSDFGIALSNTFTYCNLVNLNYIPTELFQNCVQVSIDNDLDALESNFHISQHPLLSTISLSWDASVKVEQIRLIDLNGKLIQSTSLSNATQPLKFNVINQPPGLFVLQIQTQQGWLKKKVAFLN